MIPKPRPALLCLLKKGSVKFCPADACNVEKEDFSMNATGNKFMILDDFVNPIISSYKKVLKNNNIEIAGIEFLIDENERLFTYDINTNTNYNSIAESVYSKKGMEEIAKFLKKELDLAHKINRQKNELEKKIYLLKSIVFKPISISLFPKFTALILLFFSNSFCVTRFGGLSIIFTILCAKSLWFFVLK